MRTIWKGTISFGLVNIPVGLYPATRTTDQIKFHLLRKSDQSPIRYKRVAEDDGKEVPWAEIIKGYEYEKDQYVVLTEDDFASVKIPSNQTVDIKEFVTLESIDPMFFDEPYYLAPEKGGDKAYALLRDALESTKQVGIAKVVIKTREHLAALKPKGKVLVLELMHFADELADPDQLNVPDKKSVGRKELTMAQSLIRDMSDEWRAEKYHDEYKEGLLKIIESKVAAGGKALPASKRAKRKSGTKVVDLATVLQQSLQQVQSTRKKSRK